MPVIYSYPRIDSISGNDLLVISAQSMGYGTGSVTVDELGQYIKVSTPDSVVRQAKKVLGPNEILSLSGPIPQFLEFIPAPGENKLLMPINIAYKLTPVSVPYNVTGSNFNIVLNSFTIGLSIPSGNINSTQVTHGWDPSIIALNTVSSIVNQPINFTFDGGTVSQGDSILTVSMLYRIIDFS